jgi:hypothetical protein
MVHIEVLDRSGEVSVRTSIARLPFTIGRGYDNDLILDDPYVAPNHVKVEQDEAGRLMIVDLGSRNGLHLIEPSRQVPSVEVSQNLRIRLGHTQLRFRDKQFVVEPELVRKTRSQAMRHGLAFQLVLLVTAVLVFGEVFLTTFNETRFIQLAGRTLAWLLAAFAWIGAWAVAGRIFTRHANFYAHANTALIGLSAGIVLYELTSYVSFALSSETLAQFSQLALAAIAGMVLFRHIRLVSRAPAGRVALASIVLVCALAGGGWLMDYMSNSDYSTRLRYATELKAPAFLLREPQTPHEFSEEAARLRQEIDQLRETN